MSYGNLRPANFHAQLSPMKIGGENLKPIDQCAMAIIQERKDERREEQKGIRPDYGMPLGANSFDQWEKRHNIMRRYDKRLDRGGMTRRPEDSLLRSPRGHYPETIRDRDL